MLPLKKKEDLKPTTLLYTSKDQKKEKQSKLRRGKEVIKIIAEIKQRNKVNRKKNQLRVGLLKDQQIGKTLPRLPVKKQRRHK